MKVLVPIQGEDVAPRFDQATEVFIAEIGEDGAVKEERTLVLPHPSADELCALALNERVHVVVCGGIEEEYYDYLTWKKIRVIDAVIGSCTDALRLLAQGWLKSGSILYGRD